MAGFLEPLLTHSCPHLLVMLSELNCSLAYTCFLAHLPCVIMRNHDNDHLPLLLLLQGSPQGDRPLIVVYNANLVKSLLLPKVLKIRDIILTACVLTKIRPKTVAIIGMCNVTMVNCMTGMRV